MNIERKLYRQFKNESVRYASFHQYDEELSKELSEKVSKINDLLEVDSDKIDDTDGFGMLASSDPSKTTEDQIDDAKKIISEYFKEKGCTIEWKKTATCDTFTFKKNSKPESAESDFAFEQGKVRFNEVVKSMCTSLSVFDARKSVKYWVSVDKCVDKLTEAINIARAEGDDSEKAEKFMELIEQAQHELDADREWQDMPKAPNKTYQQEKEELDKKVKAVLESMPQVVYVEPDTKYGFYNVTLKAVYCEPENLKKFYDEVDEKIKQELPNDSDDIMITTLNEEGEVVDY